MKREEAPMHEAE